MAARITADTGYVIEITEKELFNPAEFPTLSLARS